MDPATTNGNAFSPASTTTTTTATTAAQRAAKATPLLTCERCRDRKVKCDKLDPCTNCVVAHVVCVAPRRMRLPRGRHATASTPSSGATVLANEDLRRRIRKLESVIERMSSWRDGPPTSTASSRYETPDGPPNDAVPPGQPILLPMQGPDEFWAYLVEEMHGLREVVDSAAVNVDDEFDDGMGSRPQSGPTDGTMTTASTPPELVDRSLALVGLRGLGPSSDLPGISMDASMASKLCEIYLRQVDPIIKILHRPSVSRWLLQGQAYLDYPPGHASTTALRSAIFYFAACSLSENQCRTELAMQRTDLVATCRSQCETAMEQSGLLTTRDITVLQAFVLYLFARKIDDKSQAVWTLVALAVRVAHALRLDQPPKHPAETTGPRETFFSQQARRRLWATLCLLDMQAAQIQVTQPLIGSEGKPFSFVLPAHINDADFGPDTMDPVPDKEGITDTTNAHVTYRIQLLGRGMVSAATVATKTGTPSPRDTWQQQARQFEQQVLGLLHFCDPESSDFAWYTWHGTHSLVFAARVFALRPILSMQRTQPHGQGQTAEKMSAVPAAPSQKVLSQSLQLVTHVLEKVLLILTDPRGEGFRWYITIQWHMLIIAVSDCYLCADIDLVRRCWPVVEEVYRRYEANTERNRGGTMKRPLSQLMCRTRDRVATLLGNGSDSMNRTMDYSMDCSMDCVVPSMTSQVPFTTMPDTSLAIPTTVANTPSLSTATSSIDVDPLIGQNMWDDSGQQWGDLLSGVSFEDLGSLGDLGDLGSPGMYFI